MNKARYRFSNFIAHDHLIIQAVLAKELLQENDKIFQIFRETGKYLNGDSSSQATSLMIQNNRSIFTSSPSKESYLINALSLRGLSTPVTKNPETLNKARRVLPLDDAERAHHSRSEPSTPVRRQTVIVSPKNKAIASPSIDDTGTEDEKFTCEFDFTGSAGAKKQDSPRSAELTKIASNLTMSEEVFKSPVKVAGTCHKVSSPSVEVPVITQNLTMAEKDTPSPVKEEENQIPSRSAEITRMTSSQRVEDKKSLGHDDQISGKSAKSADFFNQQKDDGKSYGIDQTKKDYRNHTQEIAKISKPTTNDIPSPAKRAKINDDSASSIEASASPNEKFRIITDSPKMSEVTIKKLNESPSDASKVLVKGEKKNHFTPIKRNTTIFKSVPKVIKLPGESEIDIEVSYNSDDNASPSTSKSFPADYGSDLIKDINISPVAVSSEAKTFPTNILKRCLRYTESETPVSSSGNTSQPEIPDNNASPSISKSLPADYGSGLIRDDINISPVAGSSETKLLPTNISERDLRFTERETPICFSGNVSQPNSPVSSGDFLSAKSPSDIFSEEGMTTSDESSEYASDISSGSNIETNPSSLVQTIMRFNDLLTSREQFMQKMHRSLLSFQNNLQFVHDYVQNLGNIALRIAISDQEYSTIHVQETVHEIGAIALKLKDRLELWKRSIDSDVEMWEKFSPQINHLKTLNEPLLTDEGIPAANSRTIQLYEFEIKAKWRRIDEIILNKNSKMSSFFYIAYDVEKLINLFVQSLILVGILQPH